VSRMISIAVLALVALLAPAVAAASAPERGAHQQCAHADTVPVAGNLDEVRAGILCLHNQIRARHGLPPLRENARLRRAALGHSRAMVGERYFEHTTPDGTTMVDRILRARYARPNDGWTIGENLAWGTGPLATARGAVDGWMASPGHRANILRRTYRELGVGIVLGVPVSDAAGATYTVDFGVRR
jgi:uncharacterized protein YkwD